MLEAAITFCFDRVLPNGMFRSKAERRKNFISSQLDTCKDFSSLFYVLPFQKGYLLNWDVQRQIWDHVFGKDVLNVSHKQSIKASACNQLSLKELLKR